jgi:hypothetical protein
MSSIIYTAEPTSTGRPDGIAFAAKGIKGYTATSLANLHLSGFPQLLDVAYEGYKHNISIFAGASHEVRKFPTTIPGVKIAPSSLSDLLFRLPPVAFKPSFTLKDDQVARFMKDYEACGTEMVKAGKTCYFIFNTPRLEVCQKFAPMHEPSFRAPAHTISPLDVLTLLHLDTVLKAFLATQTYAAFSTREEIEIVDEEEKKKEVVEDGSCDYRRDNHDVSINLPLPEQIARIIAAARLAREDVTNGISGDTENLDNLFGEVDGLPDVTDTLIYAITGDEAVRSAKPSPLPYTFNCGAPADVPRSPGNLFPYFDRMLLGDKTTLKRIFFQHFTRALGGTFEEIIAEKAKMRKKLDDLANTLVYCPYAHLFTGVDLALATQSRLFVIRERGEYLGFVLLGYKYTLAMQHFVYAPATYQAVQKSLRTLSSHGRALEDICLKLSDMTISGSEEKVAINVASITGSGQLAAEIRKRDVAQKWYEKELVEDLGRLRFEKSYRPTTAQDIVSVLSSYADAPEEFPAETLPIFIPSQVNRLNDPFFCRLAIFGPEAVSPMNLRGITETLPKRTPASSDGQKPAFIEKDKQLPKIILARKPVGVACDDWKEMMKRKAFTQDVNERAQASRCLVFKPPQANGILDIMSRLSYEMGDKGTSGKGKKRKADHDMDEDRPVKKTYTADDLWA